MVNDDELKGTEKPWRQTSARGKDGVAEQFHLLTKITSCKEGGDRTTETGPPILLFKDIEEGVIAGMTSQGGSWKLCRGLEQRESGI